MCAPGPPTSTYYSLVASGVVYLRKGNTLSVAILADGDQAQGTGGYWVQAESGFSVSSMGVAEGFSAELARNTDVHKPFTGWLDIGKWRTNHPGGFNHANSFHADTGVFT